MTVRLSVSVGSSLSLDDYVAAIEAAVDFSDPDSLIASAPLLARLAANRTFLGDFLLGTIRAQGGAFQSDNNYDFQSVVLRTTPQYLLRANFWRPMSDQSPLTQHESNAFGYGVVHNHNFHLLTVGYLGGGYETDLYHLPDPWTSYRVGDEIRLEARGRERLATGDLMYFRPFEDAHVQIAPETFSVSLNLMVQAKEGQAQQYEIDAANRRVLRVIDSPKDARVYFAELAATVVPEAGMQFLDQTARGDASPRLRDLAQTVLNRSFGR